MTRPSPDLATVIAEAIQDHANHYRQGEPGRLEVLTALASVKAKVEADLTPDEPGYSIPN